MYTSLSHAKLVIEDTYTGWSRKPVEWSTQTEGCYKKWVMGWGKGEWHGNDFGRIPYGKSSLQARGNSFPRRKRGGR